MSTIEDTIVGFIEMQILEEPRAGRDPLAEQMLDSLGIEMVIAFVEDEYGIGFDDAELTAEHFASVPQLAALVRAKQQSGEADG